MSSSARRARLVGFLAFAALSSIAGLRLHAASVAGGWTASPPVAAIAIPFNLALLACIARGRGAAVRAALPRGSWRGLPADVALALALVAGTLALFTVASKVLSFDDGLLPASLLPRTWTDLAVWMAVSITAGVCEELVFRDWLQQELTRVLGGRALAVVAQAAVFGAMHGYQGSRRMLLDAAIGLAFGLVVAWRRTQRPNVLAHVLVDALAGAFAAARG